MPKEHNIAPSASSVRVPYASMCTVEAALLRPVGVTMRHFRQEKTGDTLDALSCDWGRFLTAVGLRWLPLPSDGEDTLALARELDLGGFIFSGGGDVRTEPRRDHTEALLLHFARTQGLPVLGVCRGFQALQWHLGGELTPIQGHVAVRHALWECPWSILEESVGEPSQGEYLVAPRHEEKPYRHGFVNSFHNLGILQPAPPLKPLAFGRDAAGLWHVEAAGSEGLLGIMWHPEREAVPCMEDVALVRRFFARAEYANRGKMVKSYSVQGNI